MTRTPRILPLLSLLGAACAAAPQAALAPSRPVPATQSLPAAATIESEGERARLTDATIHNRLGDAARDSGNLDAARPEWKQAGAQLVELAGSASTYRLVYLASGARLLQLGGEYDASARAAGRLFADPEADAASRALAARTRAAALNQLAAAEVKAGRADPLSNAGPDKRKGKKLEPRAPQEVWRRLVEADDAFAQSYRADADPGAAENAAGAAYQAALIQYTFDNMEDAARRLWALVDAFPGSRMLADAVNLSLQTYQVRADWAGHTAALDRALVAVGAEARRAAAAPGGAEGKARAEHLARLEDQLQKERQGLPFHAANRLLAEGKHREAAAGFDGFVSSFPEHPDAPSALYNGAIALAQSGEAKRAQAARERILAKYPDSRVAPKAALALADDFSRRNDHASAARLYALYLDKYPAGDDRCLAMLDVGIELDAARQLSEAATRYVAYGVDGRCSREDPNRAAKLLFRAASILNKAGKREETQGALKALVALPGVTDPTARSYVEDARSRVK